LALGLWLLAAIQAGTGLFASDDIFTEGPFADRISDDGVDRATAVHVRVYWLVLAAIAGHVVAIAWYGVVRRDRLALAMFTGRKAGPAVETRSRWLAAAATLAGAAAIVYGTLEYA
jgi:cytochrome b